MENKGTLIKNLITNEILTQPQQKYLAKFTKNGMCRKIKCVNDIFYVLFFFNNLEGWCLKPTSFLYLKQLESIGNNSRESVRVIINKIILKINEISPTNKNDDINNIILLINEMIELLFSRNGSELKYFLECINIILTFGLTLEDYFFSEFTIST